MVPTGGRVDRTRTERRGGVTCGSELEGRKLASGSHEDPPELGAGRSESVRLGKAALLSLLCAVSVAVEASPGAARGDSNDQKCRRACVRERASCAARVQDERFGARGACRRTARQALKSCGRSRRCRREARCQKRLCIEAADRASRDGRLRCRDGGRSCRTCCGEGKSTLDCLAPATTTTTSTTTTTRPPTTTSTSPTTSSSTTTTTLAPPGFFPRGMYE